MSGRALKRHRFGRRLVYLRDERRHAAARRREAELERKARAACASGDWDLEVLKTRVRQAFEPLQARWRPREAARARDFLSDSLYEHHREQLAHLERHDQSRRIVAPSLVDVEIVALDPAPDGSLGRAVAAVEFSAYSSLVDARNGRLIDGVHGKRRDFREQWTLVPDATRGWVIDAIEGDGAGPSAPREAAVTAGSRRTAAA